MNCKPRLDRLLRCSANLTLVLVGLSCLAGCDPVRRTTQNITLTVKDGQGRPVAGIEVRAKESWESWQTWSPEGINDGDQAHYRARWESDFVPWLHGRTDAQGEAVLKFDQTSLDGSKGRTPPPERDRVSNREYIVRLRHKDEEDELRVLMKPGKEGRGARYSLRVDSIESSNYVPVNK